MRRFCLTLLLLATPLVVELAAAGAASESSGGFLTAIDPGTLDKPIDVEAARLEGTRERAVFSGNVRVTQGDMVLTAQKLTAEMDPSVGRQGFKRLVAAGGVRITQNGRIGVGDRAVLDQGTRELVLTGKVRLIQGENVLRGDRLIVHLDERRMELQADDGGRVHARIDPQSLQKSGDRSGQARDLNTLDAREIVRLIGCSEAEAEAIVADRRARGPLHAPEDLARVAGVGPEIVDNVRRAVAGGRVRFGGSEGSP